MAQDMLHVVKNFRSPGGMELNVRIGMHSGPAIACVIGFKKLSYDVLGDSVNVASRMESHGVPGRVQVSEQASLLLGDVFELEPRGEVEVKGKGKLKCFLLGPRIANGCNSSGDSSASFNSSSPSIEDMRSPGGLLERRVLERRGSTAGSLAGFDDADGRMPSSRDLMSPRAMGIAAGRRSSLSSVYNRHSSEPFLVGSPPKRPAPHMLGQCSGQSVSLAAGLGAIETAASLSAPAPAQADTDVGAHPRVLRQSLPANSPNEFPLRSTKSVAELFARGAAVGGGRATTPIKGQRAIKVVTSFRAGDLTVSRHAVKGYERAYKRRTSITACLSIEQ